MLLRRSGGRVRDVVGRPALLHRGRRAGVAWLLLGLLLGLPGCPDRRADPSGSVRRIVLVSLDTLRADHLGTYGYPRDTSPRLDALAEEGFVFERAVAPAPNTPPSQMSMMTSLYPGRHGFTGNGDRLAPGIETLAGRLSAAGLATGGFVDGGYLKAAFGFARGFDVYDDRGGGLAGLVPRALRWLDAQGDRPFFLFLHTYDIHAPYVAPEPFAGMFHEVPYEGDLVPTIERLDALFRAGAPLSEADRQHLVDSYDEGIRYADHQLGRFLDALAERGRLDDTLIVVTSDHGEEFGEHGSLVHWQLYYQPNLHVPLIVRPPGGVEGPVRIAEMAELIDVLPTLLEWAGAPALPVAQGRSLRPWMRGEGSGRDRSERAGTGEARASGTPAPDALERAAFAWWADPEQLPLRSIIVDGHQLIFDDYAPGKDELYDIEADPMAQRDLSGRRPALAARLRALGRQGMLASPPWRPAGEEGELKLDDATREELRALGYER